MDTCSNLRLDDSVVRFIASNPRSIDFLPGCYFLPYFFVCFRILPCRFIWDYWVAGREVHPRDSLYHSNSNAGNSLICIAFLTCCIYSYPYFLFMLSQYHSALAYIISYFPHIQYPPSTRSLPTWTKHRHEDPPIPVPTFAPAIETIYDLDAPLAPTGHLFHDVLGDLPPDHIISASISRRTPYGMPYYVTRSGHILRPPI